MVGLLLASKLGKAAMRRLGRTLRQAVEPEEAAVGDLPVRRARRRLLDIRPVEHDMARLSLASAHRRLNEANLLIRPRRTEAIAA